MKGEKNILSIVACHAICQVEWKIHLLSSSVFTKNIQVLPHVA